MEWAIKLKEILKQIVTAVLEALQNTINTL